MGFRRTTTSLFTASAVCASLLSACGGGSSSSTASTTGTTTTTTTTSTTGSNDCTRSNNVFSVAGNTAQVDSVEYASDETTQLSSTQTKFSVKDGANFRGTSGLLEVAAAVTVVYSAAAANGILAGKTTGPVDVKAYVKPTTSDLLGYGYVAESSATGAVTTYFTPATSGPLSPALNTPYSQTYTATTEATATAPQTVVNTTEEVTYLGAESVSVPAGTFTACKIKATTTRNGVASTAYKWLLASGAGRGLTLKEADANGKKTMEAKVVLVNGV